jgi:hypothetical protein
VKNDGQLQVANAPIRQTHKLWIGGELEELKAKDLFPGNIGSKDLTDEPAPLQRGEGSKEVESIEVNFMVKLLRACVWMPWRK